MFSEDTRFYLLALQLEDVVLDVLQDLGLSGYRINDLTGVWLNGYKVASIGIGCRRWITQHGFALNVDCNLSGFDKIIPCGLKEHKIGKLSSFIPNLQVDDVKPLIKKSLINRFDLKTC